MVANLRVKRDFEGKFLVTNVDGIIIFLAATVNDLMWSTKV